MIRLITLSIAIADLLVSCTSASLEKKDKEPVNIVWNKEVPAKHDIVNGYAVTYNEMIYVIAGKEGRFMRYNPVDFTWMDLAGIPSPRSESGVALWHDKIVVAGGVNDSSEFMRRVDYFDFKDQVWKEMSSFPDARCRLTLSVQNDLLYASCGVCGTSDKSYSNCSDVLLYDEATKSWKGQAKLTTGRFGNVAVTSGNSLYAIGGYGFDKKVGTFYINHSKKEFGFKRDIPVSRGNFGGVLVGDFILTYGGKVPGSYSPMEKYTIAADKWETLGNCPFWTDRFASTRWHDRIYVFGGSQNPMQVWKGDIIFKK